MDRTYKYLEDITNSISNIELFLSSRPKEYEKFLEDKCLRSAVQWEIAIIGEAMNKLLKENPDVPITDKRRIVATRNYLIHGYDSLKPDIIWSIVINHLPLLKHEVNILLNQ